ncbi:MAG: hypothetical protein WBX22_21810 [Silvibacterium sp.]
MRPDSSNSKSAVKTSAVAEFRLKLFHDLVKLKRLIVAQSRHDAGFIRRKGLFRK